MRVVFEPVQGELPIAGFGQDAGYARCATNTKFWHGLLQPHQCPIEVCADKFGFDIKTLYSTTECSCIAWDAAVSIADCFCDFVFWSGDGKPQIATHEELCNGESCGLGVPCPDMPPSISVAECLDEKTPCLDECQSTYDACVEAAYSDCSELQAEVDALRIAYDGCLENRNCPTEGEEAPNCDQPRRDWVEKYLALNHCKRCAKEAVDACKAELENCKKACPDDACCDQQCMVFLYRYVNKYGQPGAPSPVSVMAETTGDATVTIPVSNDPCISHAEVFALIAGNKTGLEQKIENNSAFISQGVYPFGTSIIEINNSGLELDSWDYYPPPESLQGLICTDMGLAGFEGKNIWLSEPNQPHAWNNKKCLDHEVKCLKYWNGSLYAFTDSWIYRMNAGEGNDFGAPFRYGEKPLPLISDCRGVSVGQAGIFYPSVMGGVLVNESQARVITSKFGKDDWLSLNPKTMQTAVFDYGVGMFTDQASYMYEWGDGTFGELSGHLYQLPFRPDATHVDKNGTLNYSIGNQWFKWDACYEVREPCDDSVSLTDCCCPYSWEGESVLLDTQARFTAGFIEFVPGTGDVKLEVFENDCSGEPIYEQTFNESTEQCRKSRCFRKYFRLPSCRVEDQISIKLTGCAHVRRVVLGTSRSALRATG